MPTTEQTDAFLEIHGISAESAALLLGLGEVEKLLRIGLEPPQDAPRLESESIPLEQAWANWRAGQ